MSDSWHQRAACRGMDIDLFFPETGAYNAGRQVCRRCPVRAECLDWALSFTSVEDQAGLFGGVAPRGREDLRRMIAHKPTPLSAGA